jgi:hypothetical protein
MYKIGLIHNPPKGPLGLTLMQPSNLKEEDRAMQYFVNQITNSLTLLQAHLDDISSKNGHVVSVIWRDDVYIVIHGVNKITKS